MTATAEAPAASSVEGGVDPEVVTRSLLRLVDLPGGGGRLALVTLDNGHDHHRPTTMGAAGLRSLDEALAEVARTPDLAAVGVTGKPFVFLAGADLSAVAGVRSRSEAQAIAREGHRVLGRLGTLGIPSFAFVNGVALGGGLELALHCDYRTVSSSVTALGLPEIALGLVPGWGGAWLLPRLVGIEAALRVIVEQPLGGGRPLDALQARQVGLVDEILDSADFLAQSLVWAGRVVRGEVQPARRSPLDDPALWDGAVAHARRVVDARVRGAAPAPYRALDLLAAARTNDRAAGFAAEDEALADLLMTDETRASLYAFRLTQFRAKKPAGVPRGVVPRSVTSVGVVGAGLMARQLGLLMARKLQVPVVLTDVDQARVDEGLRWVRAQAEAMVGKGRLSEDAARRLVGSISGSVEKSALAEADLVIEAVFEDLAVKRQVLREVEAVVSPECILATNTSGLSVCAMAKALHRPDRLVGMHFFNPVSTMPLLEVVRAGGTSDDAVATAFAVGKGLGKSCVLVGDSPAFVVNRLLTRFFAEIMRLVDEGMPIPEADAAIAPLGLPMSPFTLLGLVGPAIQLHVNETLNAVAPDRFLVSDNLRRIVDAGLRQVVDRDDPGRLARGVAEVLHTGSSPSSREEVLRRVTSALADETRRLLDEGVVASPEDVDTCMLLGAGWPGHLGGLTPYLDRSGAASAPAGRHFQPPGVASVPAG